MKVEPGTVFRTKTVRPFVHLDTARTNTGTRDVPKGEHVVLIGEFIDDDVTWWFLLDDGEIVRDGVWHVRTYGLDRAREMGLQDLEEVK